jgi:hypothetical protein
MAGHKVRSGGAWVDIDSPGFKVWNGSAWVDLYTPPAGGTPTIISSNGGQVLTSTADCTGVFSGYTPALDDMILLIPTSSSTGTLAVASDGGGWLNALGSGNEVNAGSAMGIAFFYHWVTAGEVSAVTQTYTFTGGLVGLETGYTQALAIRGVNKTTPFDDIQTNPIATAVTPHDTPALSGSNLGNDSLILIGVAKDGTGDYGVLNPTGYTHVVNSNVNNARWIGVRNTPSVAGVGVASVSITPTAADEYIGFALALTPA